VIKTKKIVWILVLLVLVNLACAQEECDICDDDGDEILNADDSCPGSGTIVVDPSGCSCTQKTSAECSGDWCCDVDEVCDAYTFRARCLKDLDSDGVYDIDDSCVNTPSGEIVDSYGCSCSQKTCDDNNPCTDDTCDDAVSCVFTNDNSNSCGEEKRCIEGVCIRDEAVSALGNGEPYYTYNPDDDVLTVVYSHSIHKIDVIFEEPMEEDVKIINSSSDILEQEWNEYRTKLTLLVEGDPGLIGMTEIFVNEKPVLVKIDEEQIKWIEKQFSPPRYTLIYVSGFIVIIIILTGFVLSMKKHEDELASSVKKEEHKIEKEIHLEELLELKMYITTNLRRGYTAQQLKNQLLRDGWREDILNRAFQSLRR